MQRASSIVIIAGVLTIIIVVIGIFWFLGEVETRETVDAPQIKIPSYISAIAEPEYDQDRIYFRDYSNLMHGIFMFGGMSRSSELGNERYMPELSGYDMQERGERWLRLMTTTDNFFNDQGRLTSWFEPAGDQWAASGSVDLADYPHAVYAYHMHHRGDRWAEHGLEDQIFRVPASYITTPGRFLLDNRYADGYFTHEDGSRDYKSMSYALGGIHGHAYAWVRWAKPDGEDDMGRLEESALTEWLGYSKEAFTDINREIARTLVNYWSEDKAIYDFGDGTTWRLDAVGAMIRGQKSVYDILYMFGDDDDRELARTIFDHSAAMIDRVLPLAEAWGMPEKINFTENGAEAASDTVNIYDWYQFLNHIGGGYAWLRELEGTSRFAQRHQPELVDRVTEMTDAAMLGGLRHHLHNGRLASSINYTDGSFIDSRNNASAIGMFLTAIGNLYTAGSKFAAASDWDDVPGDVAERSRRLYNTMLAHTVLLERQFIFDAANPRRTPQERIRQHEREQEQAN